MYSNSYSQYPGTYSSRSQPSRPNSLYTYAQATPHNYEQRYTGAQYAQYGQSGGYSYPSGTAAAPEQQQQQQQQTSWTTPSAYPSASYTYGSDSQPAAKRVRLDASQHEQTPTRWGAHATYGQQPSQSAATASSTATYSDPSTVGQDATAAQQQPQHQRTTTPSRAYGSWAHQDNSYPQYRALALPTDPSPRPQDTAVLEQPHGAIHEGYQPRQPDLSHTANTTLPEAQQAQNIGSPLEHQIRGLAAYDDGVSNQQHAAPVAVGPAEADATAGSQRNDETSAIRPFVRQRGAKDGNALNLACQICQRRKMKCSRDFPCQECQSTGEECLPSTRRYRQSKKKGSIDGIPGEARPPAEDDESQVQDDAAQVTGETTVARKRMVRSVDNPNRKFLLNHPPVVGSYAHWSNKLLKYNPVPINVDAIRMKLFTLDQPVLLNSQQYADVWPHISNIYGRSVPPCFEPNGTQIEVWECRNQRRQAKGRKDQPPQGSGKRKRERKTALLEGEEPCRMRFRLISYVKHADTDEDHKSGVGNCRCAPEWLHFAKTRTAVERDHHHNHTLESMDKFKRSDAMLFFSRQKVEEGGYMYASVGRWMSKHYADKTTQVEHLTDHDIANASRPWRMLNRDLELLEHIPEPSVEQRDRTRCLDLLSTTTVHGLRKVLEEVCSQISAAVTIALPHLETAQETHIEGGSGIEDGILEGDDIVVPEPGLPQKVLPPAPRTQPPTKLPASSGLQTTGGLPADTLAQQAASAAASAALQGRPDPTQVAVVAYEAPSSHLPLATPSASLPRSTQQQGFLQQGPPTPAKPFTYKPPPPPSSTQPRVQPTNEAKKTYNAPYGGYSVIVSGQRYNMPAQGSTVAPHGTAAATFGLSSASLLNEQRPSWAKPVTKPARSAQETEKDEVARQLDAELQAHNPSDFHKQTRSQAEVPSPAVPRTALSGAFETPLPASRDLIAAGKSSLLQSSEVPGNCHKRTGNGEAVKLG